MKLFNKRQKTSNKISSGRKNRKRASDSDFKYDTLECRQLLASIVADPGSGIINVYGSTQDDGVYIRHVDSSTFSIVLTVSDDVVDSGSFDYGVYTYINSWGGEGDDTMDNRTSVSSKLVGHGGNDWLFGGYSDDIIYGGSGDDVAGGRGGDDFMATQGGNNRFYGHNGDDIIHGNTGVDRLFGGSQDDQLYGNGGNDFLYGGNDDDFLQGNDGNDLLNGQGGNDTVYGSTGNDTIWGYTGDDFLYGGSGNDGVYGGDGNDRVEGNDGNDGMQGNNGDDLLIGGNGTDYIQGGAGDDIYRFANSSIASTTTIVEANNSGMDSLDFRSVTTPVNMDASTTNGTLATYNNRNVQMASSSPEVNVENIFGVQGEDRHIFDGSGQTIAIVDSGVDYHNAALGGGIGAGFKVVGGYDFVDDDANPDDVEGHGTFVAGIAAGMESSSAPAAYDPTASASDLAAVRVLDADGNGSFTQIREGLEWIDDNYLSFANPITTVNMSLGANSNDTGYITTSLSPVLESLKDKGIFVAVAAGNSYTSYNSPGLARPASDVSVFPVANHDSSGQMYFQSQRLDRALVAFGTLNTSTLNGGGFGQNGSGTSYSSPVVAGASALLRQAYTAVGIGATPDKMSAVMFATSDDINDGGDIYQQLNLDEALAAIVIDKLDPSSRGESSKSTPGKDATTSLELDDDQLSISVTTNFVSAPVETVLMGTTPLECVELDSFDAPRLELAASTIVEAADLESSFNVQPQPALVQTNVSDSAFESFEVDFGFEAEELVTI